MKWSGVKWSKMDDVGARCEKVGVGVNGAVIQSREEVCVRIYVAA